MVGTLLLVGSIPLDTPQEVFETFGAPLGKYLSAVPDGEVGPRRHWISRVHYQVLAAHPELEVVQGPAPDENGIERQVPGSVKDAWWFRVKEGVARVRFGDPGWRLGYARDPINSYFVFTVMRERRVLPSHLRFQVSIPMVNSVLPPRIFPDQHDIEKIRPGYEEATRSEIAKIVEKIPAKDLAIQWSARRSNRPQSRASEKSFAAHPVGRCARLSFLFRDARRLAAVSTQRSRSARKSRQCLHHGFWPARGLDSHSNSGSHRRFIFCSAQKPEAARCSHLSRRNP